MPTPGLSERLFVYGTLRSGSSASGMLDGAAALGPAKIRGQLRAGPGYPVLVLQGDSRVTGELWLCDADTLAALDAYEGVDDGLFRRVRIDLEGEPAWVYVGGPRFRDRHLPLIPGGDWLAWSSGPEGRA